MPKQIILLTISVLLIATTSSGQTVIEGCKQGASLINALQNSYTPTSTLGYNKARDTMYAVIDNDGSNNVHCIYTQFSVTLDPLVDPSTSAYQSGAGINAEHVFPQSKGAGSEPAKSDLFNLFPAQVNVNSARQNSIFAEIDDADSDRWYRLGQELYSTPGSNIDEYSEREIQNGTAWEPREDAKGNIARAAFYFYTIYKTEADAVDLTFFNTMRHTLLNWHYADPVDTEEATRNTVVATYQGNTNPFITDSTLARRAYFLPDASYTNGDPNCFESSPIVVNNSASVIIIEIADPKDVYKARFVAIQNRGNTTVDVSNWALRKYSNGNTTFLEKTFPSNTLLNAGEIYIMSYNTTDFQTSYNKSPNITSGSVIEGNGDDVYTLADNNGDNTDVFGVIGVDGSNKNWEYEDAFVKRKSIITESTTSFNINEWDIYNNYTTTNILALSNALPVELLTFEATINRQTILLEWQTASEKNNDYFVVEASSDGFNFENIGIINGAGTTQERQSYSFTDNHPKSGINYYRLRQVDFDGKEEIHKIISIQFYTNSTISIFPNPAKEQLNVVFEQAVDNAAITIYNSNSQIVHNNIVENAQSQINIAHLEKGFYILKIQTKQGVTINKFVKH